MKQFLIVPLFFTSCLLFAQSKEKSQAAKQDTTISTADGLSRSNYDLSEIQVTAYRTIGQLKSTAGSISVIPAGQLENSAFNIASSLSAVPGLVMQEGSPGTIKLTLRGIGSRYPYGTKKIKLFFGDIPMYSAEGETTFDDINPEYISRVEVLRGPASSIYGSSLGGTVILYPQSADFNREVIKLNSSAGSFGYFKNGVTYSNGTAKNNLVLSVSGIESDGYRQNSKYSRYSFFINQQQIFSAKLSGNLILSGSKIRALIPSSIDSVTLISNPQKAAASWLKTKGYEHPDRVFAGYNLHYKTLNDWDYSLSTFLNSRKTEENRPFNFLNESGFSYGVRILGQHTKKMGEITFQFAAGTNLYFENIQSMLTENIGGKGIKGIMQQDGKESLYQNDIFTQIETRYRNVAITAGLNFNQSGFRFTDLTPDTLNQSGNYQFSAIIAPRLSFTWNPWNDLYFYTSINKGFSVPSLSETLSPLGLINREIKPEKAWSFEGGTRVNLFNHATFIDLAYYYMRVTDLIVPKRVAEEIYVGMNAGSSIHRGLEISLQQWIIGQLNKTSDHHFALIANLNYANNKFNFQDFKADNIDYSGKKLPGMPDQLFSGSLDFKTPYGFYSRLELATSGQIPLNDLNSRYSKAWATIALKAGYAFKLFQKLKIDSAIKINNITDQKYSSMVVVNAPGSGSVIPRYFYPGLPRWIICTVNISFQNFHTQQK
jgi:iron complex outermembrane receptor protein